MRHLSAKYTKLYNQKYKIDGPLFRGRFKSILVEEDSYLLALVRYIHLNPVKANLCKTARAHPWTSQQAYESRSKRPGWLKVNYILSQFARTEEVARKRRKNCSKQREDLDVRDRLGWPKPVSVLGSDGFKQWVKDNLLDKTRRDKIIPAIRDEKRKKLSQKRIIDFVCQEYQTKPRHLNSRSGNQPNEVLSLAIYLFRNVNGWTHQKIADALDMQTSEVSKNLQRTERRMKDNRCFGERNDACLRNLLSYVQSDTISTIISLSKFKKCFLSESDIKILRRSKPRFITWYHVPSYSMRKGLAIYKGIA